MNEGTEDEIFDARLRDAAPYIDDDGFTTRVMQRMPAARNRRRNLRAWILIGSALLASAIAYVLSDGGRAVSEGVYRLALLPIPVLWLLALAAGVLVSVGAVLTGISKAQEMAS